MIQVSHLTKWYGDHLAVDDLSFEIPQGAVYGFLGPNGAGKSTTLNILTGCLSPTAGQVLIDGADILEEPEKAKRCLGYLPEQPPLYFHETPQEYLEFVGEAKGVRGKALQAQLDAVMERTGIDQVRHQIIGSLSKGYRQRVGIAQALLGEPKAIILDEPTVGLDPIQILEIRDLIRKLGKTHTVVFSSHILSEVQAICEKVLIIAHGKLVALDTPENLEKLLKGGNGVTFRADCGMEEAECLLKDIPGIAAWKGSTQEGLLCLEVTTEENADMRKLCGEVSMVFASAGKPVLEMKQKKANLEDVFLELAGGEKEEEA